MRRQLLGLFGLLLILSGGVILWNVGYNDSQWSMIANICLRAGLILAFIWLAFPQLIELFAKFPPWLIVGGVGSLFVLARYPKAIVIIVPLFAILGLLHFSGWLFSPLPVPKKSDDDKEKPVEK